MAKGKKIVIIIGAILLVILIVASILWIVHSIAICSVTGGRAHSVGVIISLYIEANHGDFPTSEGDLLTFK